MSAGVVLILAGVLAVAFLRYRRFKASLMGRRKQLVDEAPGSTKVQSTLTTHTLLVSTMPRTSCEPSADSSHRKEEVEEGRTCTSVRWLTGRSGALARLNIQIDEQKKDDSSKGKNAGLLRVEKFLSDEQGVNVQETKQMKVTEAGKKKVTIQAAAVAVMASGGSSDSASKARQSARGQLRDSSRASKAVRDSKFVRDSDVVDGDEEGRSSSATPGRMAL